MTKETKNLSLIDFKATDEGGNGGFTAIATTFGELDSVGDIILAGAYKKTIPQFLKKGFIARNHSWSSAIGMPVDAKENDEGLIVEARYHSTEEAKAARLVTNERTEQGLEIAVSIGYELSAPPIYVYPKDYSSELPKYVRADLLESAMQMAPRFAKVRVLPEIHLYEISLVQVGALESALVLSAKNAPPTDTPALSIKGMFEDELASRTNSPYALFDIFCSVIWKIAAMEAVAEETGLQIDIPQILDEALAEFTARLRDTVLAGMGYDAVEGDIGIASKEAGRGLVDGLAFATYLEAVVDAAEGIVKRAKAKAQKQAKEGRTISAATADKLRSLLDRIEEMRPLLTELLEAATPKDKDEEKAAQPTKDELRQQVTRFLVWDALRKQEEYACGQIPATS